MPGNTGDALVTGKEMRIAKPFDIRKRFRNYYIKELFQKSRYVYAAAKTGGWKMKCVDRNGQTISGGEGQERMLAFLYGNPVGRGILKVLIQPGISRMAGRFLDSSLSKWLIGPFVRKTGIDLTQYQGGPYPSYNAFFTRRIVPGLRPVDMETQSLIAPCDSRLSVYPVTKEGIVTIKNTPYTMESLFRSKKLAEKYEGGWLLVFRLAVDDYHRYCYIDEGTKTRNYHIPGVFHTVNPLANDVYPIYKENTREFSILKSRNFGRVLMMEVGALLVGRIINHHQEQRVQRGQEKGYFAFGGSTVILCLEKGKAVLDADILCNSEAGIETKVKFGERIGQAL